MGDFSRKSALSIRNWVANKIIEGIKSTNRGSFLKDLDFTHIASCLIWNAAEPTDKGGWPTVLQDICGREALAKNGGVEHKRCLGDNVRLFT